MAGTTGEVFVLNRCTHYKGSSTNWEVFTEQNQECWYCNKHSMAAICFDISKIDQIEEIELTQTEKKLLDFPSEMDASKPYVLYENNNWVAAVLRR